MTYKLSSIYQKVELYEVADYVNEKVKINNCKLSKYISTTNMIENRGGIVPIRELPKAKTINSFKKGDVLISNIRPYFKKIWFATFNGTSSTDVLIFRNKENIYNRFLYYVLSSDSFFDYSTKSAKGTKMPRGDKEAILKYKIPRLNLEEQTSIANTLSSLDNKIELNNKINKNLEQQAKELFKYFFIDFKFPDTRGNPYKSNGGRMIESDLGMIPEGWNVVKLSSKLKVELGGTPARKNENYWNGNINWINSGELNSYRIFKSTEKITQDGLDNSSTKLWPKNTTVIAITGTTLGKTSILLIDTCANQSVVGIKENSDIPYTFIYPYILSKIPELTRHKTGGAQQHINKGNFEDLKLLIPNKEILSYYNEIIKSHYKKIELNEFENIRLAQIRDLILPRLMSGEIRIPLN